MSLFCARSCPFLALFLSVCLVASCQRSEEAVETTPETEPAAEAVAESPPETAEAPEMKPEPETPPAPSGPVLEVREDEAAGKIFLSGTISSKYQKEDLIRDLGTTFASMEIVDELSVDKAVTEVVWGNRIGDLLLPFLQSAENARFHYAEGVTTLQGTVEKGNLIGRIGSLGINVMEAPDALGFKNEVKAKE